MRNAMLIPAALAIVIAASPVTAATRASLKVTNDPDDAAFCLVQVTVYGLDPASQYNLSLETVDPTGTAVQADNTADFYPTDPYTYTIAKTYAASEYGNLAFPKWKLTVNSADSTFTLTKTARNRCG